MKETEKKKLRRSIGKFIHKKRVAYELKQQDLAMLIHVATSTISAIERGCVLPGIHIMMELAEHLDFSLDEMAEEIR